jgi:hypothetical protein
MIATHQPPPMAPCRTCSASTKSCEAQRAKGSRCCYLCAHHGGATENTTEKETKPCR